MVEVKQIILCKCASCGVNKYAAIGASVHECVKQAGGQGWSVDLLEGRAWCESCARERRERFALIDKAIAEASVGSEAASPPIT